MTTPGNGDSRRSFLSFLTKALAGAIGLCLAAPAVAYITSPLWGKRGRGGPGPDFSDAGAVADLPVGEWRAVTLEVVRRDGWETARTRRTAWVRRAAEGDAAITVLSPICPHLGCPINWSPDRAAFVCPCHKGVFDGDGKLVSGPPPRGMDALEWEVRVGRLFVRWQDFKIGVATSSPVEV
jgi:menaquinol-cytochrome c reductase iron-sulfur subunit